MFRILESQAPAKQTATDTINTLTSRLQSVTLLEDRRAAILGLRSFAKLYPASVASGALRPLISSLRNDQEDVDTIKVVLETLMNLFSPDESSPEASDEIALWLADEFTQVRTCCGGLEMGSVGLTEEKRQDNITTLLDLLETRDFYPRLYSLQLISLISTARPERTQECIFTAPLGIPRLVSTLSDVREPVRNGIPRSTEALVLLIALTPASEELQKLVAFENTFETVFSLIEAEGALTHGSEVVEDCLALLANLLKLNVSNQSYFRETGCIKGLAKLLADVNQDQDPDGPPSPWVLAHRDKNIWGTLAIVQLFLVKGGVNTQANQMAFWKNGVMEQVLNIAFGQRFTVNVISKALATCADLIRGNSSLQEQFGDVEVLWGHPRSERAPNGEVVMNGVQRVNVIEALLKLTLEPSPSIQQLDARLAACECIKAFFANHPGIRMHVLRRAIDGHVSGQDEIPNIMSVLLTPPESRGNADPYQTWIASVLMFHLVFEDPEAKAMAMKVTEGDAESGEEVITCVQTIVGHLITGMQRGDDERISVGYLMLLCGWLFEDPDVVNDFLGEGSSIQSLLQETKHRGAPNALVAGLCTILLGIIYEFSSRESPISRHTLHKLLLEQMGRDQYIDKITRFRESPLVRDFEVLPQTVGAHHDGGLPDIFFDRTFVDFLKDNFSRLLRAVDREPGLEISVITNGVQKGISREMVDSLRAELEDRNQAVQKLEADLVNLKQKVEQEQFEFKKAIDSSSLESSRIKQVNEALQRNHAQELQRLEAQNDHAKNELLRQHSEQLRAIDSQFKQAAADHERKSQETRQYHEAEVANLQKTIRSLESDIARSKEQQGGEVVTLHKTIQSLESDLVKAQEQHAGEVAGLKESIQSLESEASKIKEQHTGEVADLKKAIQNLESDANKIKEQQAAEVASLRKTIEKSEADTGKLKEQHAAEVSRLKETIDNSESDAGKAKEQQAAEVASLRETIEDSEADTRKLKEKHAAEVAELKGAIDNSESGVGETRERHATEIADMDKKIQSLQSDIDAIKTQHEKEVSSHKATIETLQSDLDEAKERATQDTQAAHDDYSTKISALEKRAEEAGHKAGQAETETKKNSEELQTLRTQLEKAKSEAKEKEEASKSSQSALDKAKEEAKEKEEARKAAQSELEDLLIVFGDLEAKRNEDKKRLKDLGQEVSEAEDDDDEDNEEEDDE